MMGNFVDMSFWVAHNSGATLFNEQKTITCHPEAAIPSGRRILLFFVLAKENLFLFLPTENVTPLRGRSRKCKTNLGTQYPKRSVAVHSTRTWV